MYRVLLNIVLTGALAMAMPVYADDQEEGLFSRTWRGFKSAVGMGEERSDQKQTRKAELDDDDDDHEDKAKKAGKHAKEKHARKAEDELESIRRSGRFSEEQASLIRAALGDSDDEASGKGKGKKPKKLPPGLKKKLERGGELPPGWKMKFERGEVVSDEVWAQSHALPDDLAGQIGTIAGTELIQVNDRVARVLSSTREILDVIDLVTGP